MQGPPMSPRGWAAPPQMSPRGAGGDVQSEDAKLRKRIGWLNGQGGFDGAIVYDKILQAAGGLEFAEVFQKLQHLEESKDTVKDPTSWICAGLRKSASRQGPPQQQMAWGGQPMYGGGGFDGGAMDVEATSKLHKKIKWLNDPERFDGALDFQKISEAAGGVDSTSQMKVLKEVEEKKAEIKDPTAYVSSAFRKAGGGRKGGGKGMAPAGAMHGVRRTIAKR